MRSTTAEKQPVVDSIKRGSQSQRAEEGADGLKQEKENVAAWWKENLLTLMPLAVTPEPCILFEDAAMLNVISQVDSPLILHTFLSILSKWLFFWRCNHEHIPVA